MDISTTLADGSYMVTSFTTSRTDVLKEDRGRAAIRDPHLRDLGNA